MITLVVAVLCIVVWGVLTFVMPVSTGLIHLLLAVGVTLLVRWWALRDQARLS